MKNRILFVPVVAPKFDLLGVKEEEEEEEEDGVKAVLFIESLPIPLGTDGCKGEAQNKEWREEVGFNFIIGIVCDK